MAFLKCQLIPLQEMSKEDLIDYVLKSNEEMTKDIEWTTYKLKTGEVFKINENLLKLIEDIVIETLNRIEERNNTKVSEKIGKSFRYMF